MLVQAPRLVSEVGKIRIGDRIPIEKGANKGDPQPHKVTEFILTANNPLILNAAAQVYGGTVEEWVLPEAWKGKGTKPDHKYRLYTTSNILKIVFRASQLIDTTRERWEGAWCVRRCNGRTITFDGYDRSLIGRTCDCPEDHVARKELATRGKACQEVSRIQVQIYDLPYGYWRLDTRGYFGPAEMRDLYDYLETCGLVAHPIEAMLRLETATARRIEKTRDGEQKKVTLHYAKVVIEPIYTAAQLAMKGAEAVSGQKSLPENIADLYPPGPATASTALMARPAAKSTAPHTLDEAEFSYRLETLWQAAGLDEHAREARKLRLVERCHGLIRPEWYAQILTEQQAWVAARHAKAGTTSEAAAAPEDPQTPEPSTSPPEALAASPDEPRVGLAWETIREHADNPKLPDDLRAQLVAVLHSTGPLPEGLVYMLASAVRDVLDAASMPA